MPEGRNNSLLEKANFHVPECLDDPNFFEWFRKLRKPQKLRVRREVTISMCEEMGIWPEIYSKVLDGQLSPSGQSIPVGRRAILYQLSVENGQRTISRMPQNKK